MADSEGDTPAAPRGPAGRSLLRGPCGTQIRSTKGHRWSEAAEKRFLDQLAATCNVTLAGEAAEKRFLDQLAATCNVTLAGEACGFTHAALYRRRRNDPGFMQRWDAALAQGYAHLEALLVRRACDALEGVAPDPAAAVRIPEVTMRDALTLLGHHRRKVEGQRGREWAREPPIEDVRANILRKLEAIDRARRAQEAVKAEAEAAAVEKLTALLGR